MPPTPARPAALLFGAALLLLSGSLTPRHAEAQAQEVGLEALTETSTAVVVGAVEAKTSRWDESRTRIYTEIRLRVSDRIKGEAEEETVVLVPGGQVGNTLYEVSDMPVFVEGEEVLVFLWKDPAGRHLVTGAAQGKLRVLTDEAGARTLEPGAAALLGARGAANLVDPGAPLLVPGGGVALDAFVRAVRAAAGQ